MFWFNPKLYSLKRGGGGASKIPVTTAWHVKSYVSFYPLSNKQRDFQNYRTVVKNIWRTEIKEVKYFENFFATGISVGTYAYKVLPEFEQ